MTLTRRTGADEPEQSASVSALRDQRHPFPLPQSSWSLWIDPEGHSGAWNMAADASLLRAAQSGASWIRLYRWSPACLSFGRNEPALTRYDRDRISARGLDVVRRPTGGRAVWHDAEITYAIAAPLETFGSLADTYLAIHELLASALRRVGLAAGIAARPADGQPGLTAGSCFASPAGGEVVVNGRKLVGSAQLRDGAAFLQHGSILLEDRQDVVTSVTRGASSPPLAISIASLLGRLPTFAEVTGAIAAELGTSGIGPLPSSPSHPRFAGAVAQGRQGSAVVPLPHPEMVRRFEDPVWTWRR
jgi:lipoyl(octanoyl) transferase